MSHTNFFCVSRTIQLKVSIEWLFQWRGYNNTPYLDSLGSIKFDKNVTDDIRGGCFAVSWSGVVLLKHSEQSKVVSTQPFNMQSGTAEQVWFVKFWSFHPPLHTSSIVSTVHMLVVAITLHSIVYITEDCDMSSQLKNFDLRSASQRRIPSDRPICFDSIEGHITAETMGEPNPSHMEKS